MFVRARGIGVRLALAVLLIPALVASPAMASAAPANEQRQVLDGDDRSDPLGLRDLLGGGADEDPDDAGSGDADTPQDAGTENGDDPLGDLVDDPVGTLTGEREKEEDPEAGSQAPEPAGEPSSRAGATSDRTEAAAELTPLALTGRRCDVKHLGRRYEAPVAGGGIPGRNQQFSRSPEAGWDTYDVENPSRAMDGLKEPSPQQAKLAGSTDADIAKWRDRFEKTQDLRYLKLKIYAQYAKNLKGNPRQRIKDFRRYVDVRIIGNELNNRKGAAFERRIVERFRMVGPDWLCEVEVKVKDKNGNPVLDKKGRPLVRKYDAYNARTREFVEFKSNGKHRAAQLRMDRRVLRMPEFKNHSMRLVTGEKTSPNTQRQYRALNAQIQRETGRSNGVTIREQRSTALPRYTPDPRYTRYSSTFNPSTTRVGTGGSIDQSAYRQGRTPEQARQNQRLYQGANTRGGFGRPGGVDFSTLELNYVGNAEPGEGIGYSFRADYVPDEDEAPGWGGEQAIRLASDAYFTWLALTPDKFWVNLNPDQPEEVMDDGFASTDAGRILLEADLEMKRDWWRVLDNRTEAGEAYWERAPQVDGLPCMPQVRLWITPRPAQVREQDGGIYILDAPLRMQVEQQDLSTQPPGERNPCLDMTDEQNDRGVSLARRYIVPEVEELINDGEAYKDLRTVYRSRVAAEWVRQQDAERKTDFRSIIDSNDVSRWPLRAPNKDWDKNELWEEYLDSYLHGEFEVEVPGYDGETYIAMVGGVDFSKAPKRNITRLRFNAENPRLDTTTRTSLEAETAYRSTETAYLGGGGNGVSGGDGPNPEPTDPGEPDPGEPGPGEPDPGDSGPTEPGPTATPAPSDPAPSDPGDLPSSTPPQDDGSASPPDDDLATTGADVARLVGIAALLVVTGAAALWWRKRRMAALD